jgi:amino acid adenylation domain-containing protein/non-ribosomal peptide synthase protein (TIGR01720 family)
MTVRRLSPSEEGVLALRPFVPTGFNGGATMRVRARIDADALGRAWGDLVAALPEMRNIYDDANLVVRTAPPTAACFQYVDLTNAEAAEIATRVKSEYLRPYLAAEPTYRLNLFAISPNEHVIQTGSHHIGGDGPSAGWVRRELARAYRARVDGEVFEASPGARYGVFAEQWLASLESDEGKRMRAWWQERLAGWPLSLELPRIHAGPRRHRGASSTFVVDEPALRGLLERFPATKTFHVLFAIWITLLHRYANQDRFLITTPASLRTKEFLQTLGNFTNLLTIRCDFRGKPRFREVLSRAIEELRDSGRHRGTPFGWLVRELPGTAAEKRLALQTGFSLSGDDTPWAGSDVSIAPWRWQFAGMDVEPIPVLMHAGQLELNFVGAVVGGALYGELKYDTDAFDTETVDRIGRSFVRLIEAVTANPDIPVGQLDVLADPDAGVLAGWNRTERAVDERFVPEQLEAQVARIPDAIAVELGDESITYRELDDQAARWAAELATHGIGNEDIVPVVMERSIAMVVAVLAILKTGAAYAPLDPQQPPQRLAFMLRDLRCRVVLTDTGCELPGSTARVFPVVLPSPSTRRLSVRPVAGGQLAYVIYTSGSTGEPKAAMLTHRALRNIIAWSIATMGAGGADTFLQQIPYTFDPSVTELFTPLLMGGRIVLAKPGGHRDADYLETVTNEHRVTSVYSTPLAIDASLESPDRAGRRLSHVVSGGDVLKPSVVERFHAAFSATLHNCYGPTETAVIVTHWPCPRGVPLPGSLPIGKPIWNTRVHIVAEDGSLCPPGVVGELWIGGDQLARGYLDRPGLTAEKFVPDPFSATPGARLYRSGDLARWRNDGLIEFVGRRDHQVKVRGFRVELEEVEAHLASHDAVAGAVVIAREENGTTDLVGYVVAKENARILPAELRAHVAERVPEYMVPSIIAVLDAFPTTVSGKVDRNALPAVGRPTADVSTYRAPEGPTEEVLVRLFAETLHLPVLDTRDNFFEIGGDSIRAIQLASRSKRVGLAFTVADLYAAPSVATLARRLSGGIREIRAEQGPLTGRYTLAPIHRWYLEQAPIAANEFNQSRLLSIDATSKTVLEQSLEALVRQHDALRLRFFEKEEQWEASFAEETGAFPLEIVDLAGAPRDQWRALIEERTQRAPASLNLQSGPIARAIYFDLGEGQQCRLFLIVHHFAVDALSWSTILEDLHASLRDSRSALPPKTTSIQEWSESLAQRARSPAVREELSFWLGQPWARGAHVGQPRGTVAQAAHVRARLDAATTRTVLGAALAPYRLSANAILLTALVRALAIVDGRTTFIIDVEGQGREAGLDDVDVSRTVGWFTDLHPVLLSVEGAATIAEALVAVKEQLAAFARRAPTYRLLRFMGDDAERNALAALPRAQVAFNYFGSAGAAGPFDRAPEASAPWISPRAQPLHSMELNVLLVGEELHAAFAVDSVAGDESTARRLADQFIDELRAIATHSVQPDAGALTPTDVGSLALDQATLDRITERATGARSRAADVFPLSALQEGLLFHHLLDPGHDAYVLQTCIVFDGGVDADALSRSFQVLADRHDALRTSFLWEDVPRPLQIVHRHVDFPFVQMDWSDVPEVELDERVRAWMEKTRSDGFDLRKSPLSLAALIRTAADYRLVWTTHHIILDGWSGGILRNELYLTYRELTGGPAAKLRAAGRYRTYVDWLADSSAGSEPFFRRLLAGFSEPTIVHPAGPPTTRWEIVTRALPSELVNALTALGRRCKATLSTILHAAWGLLLGQYCGRQDVLFGSIASGRAAPIADIEQIAGLFINAVPIRIRIRPESLEDWLGRLQEEFNELRSHEHVPLTTVQSWSDVPNGRPLFDSLLLFENYPIDRSALESSGLKVRRSLVVEQTHYPLTLTAVVRNESVDLSLSFDAERFVDGPVPSALDHLTSLLRLFAAGEIPRVDRASALGAEEKRKILVEWNATERPLPSSESIHGLFEAQASRSPNATAVEFEGTRLTYRELDDRANRIASWLVSQGVGLGDRVVVELPRSIDMLASILGVLKAGAAYVPIDLRYPDERRRFVREDSQAKASLTSESLQAALRGTGVVRRHVRRANLAYVLYTSGSTGRPKGVLVSHGSVVNFLDAMAVRPGLTASDVLVAVTTLSFDIAGLELYLPLVVGAKVVIASAEVAADGVALASLLESSKATVVQATPATWRMLLASGWVPTPRFRALCGGEPMPVDLAASLTASVSAVFNMYGPTETTIWSSTTEVTSGERITVGKPINNTTLYVVDHSLAPLPAGVPGELLIGGAGLAHGYHGRPSLTAERFIPDPFSSAAGARLYRTGDLARWLPTGEIELLGRIDDQVKIRGFRIELGEIEATLAKLGGVGNAVVVAREDTPGDKRLVAYFVKAGDEVIDAAALRAALASELPEYMIPSAFVALESFPLTPNGKVDRRALPKVSQSLTTEYVAPRDATEEALASIWQRVLARDRIGIFDNFFELGGHSLLATLVMSRVAAELNVAATVRDIFEFPTIAALAETISARAVDEGEI